MDDRSGVVTFCLGLTVIVLASVALSMVVEKRFLFSEARMELDKDIREGAEEVQFLRATIAQAEMRHLELAYGADERVKRHAAALAKRTALQEKRAGLDHRKSEAQAGIEALDDQSGRYRADYRKVTWEKAIGERIPELKTRDGRGYAQAVIAKVTGTGLEVRHEHGYARISAEALSDELQDRFQWE